MKKIKILQCELADEEHRKAKRQYAHTYHHKNVICLAWAWRNLTFNQFWAIMAHEFGHLLAGYEGSERDANRAANEFFGVKILYRDSAQGKHLETVSTRDGWKIKRRFDSLL